ncbi:alpha/beta fold hydrolase [Halioglobus sp. HI00S01]|uniref:alpha/beta fold hydrolase n=1 Tax=Halioglobus sp. HI00S01 TaxID=1822214 RepID=UPI002101D467|nr:alpha/beta hydrolase [Halioglobus sp. HI00S01]
MLCMHGLTRNSAEFAGLAHRLSERYRGISADCLGRGKSEYDTNTANYNPGTYVQDMVSLLADLDIDQVMLCGTSMGGLMQFIVAATQPAGIRDMIINDIGPEIDQRGLDRIKAYVGKTSPVTTWGEAIQQARELKAIAFPNFTDDKWLGFTQGIHRDKGGVPVLAYDAAISQPADRR